MNTIYKPKGAAAEGQEQ